MTNDALHEVRRVRREISNECGGDPQRIFEFYQKHQEEVKKSGRYQFINARMEIADAAHATEQTTGVAESGRGAR